MATTTTNLGLTKPAYTDAADIAVINDNMDTLDLWAGQKNDAIAKILPVISGTTNNSGYAISAGEYFEANGKLYKATASIPTGNAWSSSATELSDHGAINALKSNLSAVSEATSANGGAINISSRSDLNSKIQAIANGLTAGKSKLVVIYTSSFSDDIYKAYTNYSGFIVVNNVSSGVANYFSANLVNNKGEHVVISCENGSIIHRKKASYSFASITTADITLYNCTLYSAYKHKVGYLVTYEFDILTTADIPENGLLLSGLEQTNGTKGIMVTFYASHSGGLLHYMLTTGDSYVHARSSIPNDTRIRFTFSYLTATYE